MVSFWLNCPESLVNLNVTDVNGVLNLITTLVIIATLYGIYVNAPNALNFGILAIIIIIIIYSCGEGQFDCFGEETEDFNPPAVQDVKDSGPPHQKNSDLPQPAYMPDFRKHISDLYCAGNRMR